MPAVFPRALDPGLALSAPSWRLWICSCAELLRRLEECLVLRGVVFPVQRYGSVPPLISSWQQAQTQSGELRRRRQKLFTSSWKHRAIRGGEVYLQRTGFSLPTAWMFSFSCPFILPWKEDVWNPVSNIPQLLLPQMPPRPGAALIPPKHVSQLIHHLAAVAAWSPMSPSICTTYRCRFPCILPCSSLCQAWAAATGAFLQCSPSSRAVLRSPASAEANSQVMVLWRVLSWSKAMTVTS